MNADIAFYSNQGKRDKNEDSVAVIETNDSIIAIVADGLGGHNDGEIASRLAIATIRQALAGCEPDEDLLIDAIQQANNEIYSSCSTPNAMFTTIAVLWIGKDFAVIANVGDTRIYQFRSGEIVYQSLDHSKAQMAVLVGQLDLDAIRQSKDRNKLIRVLGTEEPPRVDCRTLNMQTDDRFLLCSDGFWEPVTEWDMNEAIVNSTTSDQWLKLMKYVVERTNNPSQDNHSAVGIIIS